MHDTAKRLLEIGQDAGAKDFTEIAKWLGGSDQSATNWKTRGVPKEKIIEAAEKFGVSVSYLRAGTLPKYVTLSKTQPSPAPLPIATIPPLLPSSNTNQELDSADLPAEFQTLLNTITDAARTGGMTPEQAAAFDNLIKTSTGTK